MGSPGRGACLHACSNRCLQCLRHVAVSEVALHGALKQEGHLQHDGLLVTHLLLHLHSFACSQQQSGSSWVRSTMKADSLPCCAALPAPAPVRLQMQQQAIWEPHRGCLAAWLHAMHTQASGAACGWMSCRDRPCICFSSRHASVCAARGWSAALGSPQAALAACTPCSTAQCGVQAALQQVQACLHEHVSKSAPQYQHPQRLTVCTAGTRARTSLS